MGKETYSYSFRCGLFNLHSRSCTRTIKEAYKHQGAQKQLKYEQGIVEVENSSFNRLVFATAGGTTSTVSKGLTRLEFGLNEKRDAPSVTPKVPSTQTKTRSYRFCCWCNRGRGKTVLMAPTTTG